MNEELTEKLFVVDTDDDYFVIFEIYILLLHKSGGTRRGPGLGRHQRAARPRSRAAVIRGVETVLRDQEQQHQRHVSHSMFITFCNYCVNKGPVADGELASSWDDFAGEIEDEEVRQRLAAVYGHPRNVDVWVRNQN